MKNMKQSKVQLNLLEVLNNKAEIDIPIHNKVDLLSFLQNDKPTLAIELNLPIIWVAKMRDIGIRDLHYYVWVTKNNDIYGKPLHLLEYWFLRRISCNEVRVNNKVMKLAIELAEHSAKLIFRGKVYTTKDNDNVYTDKFQRVFNDRYHFYSNMLNEL